jgi:hypothetical protein
VVSDGHGSNAWHVVFPTSSVTGYNAYNSELQDASSSNLPMAKTFPVAVFARSVVWLPTFSTDAYLNNEWMTGSQCANAGCATSALEMDGFEIDYRQGNPGGGASGGLSWNPGNQTRCGSAQCLIVSNWQGINPPNYGFYDPTSGYHTVDMRITHDGASAIYKCMWLDGTFINCSHYNVDGGILTTAMIANNSRSQYILFQIGCNCNDPGFQFTVNQYDGFLKQVYVWSCANWQTTSCASSTPDPGNY